MLGLVPRHVPHLPAGMSGYVRPNVGYTGQLDGMPDVPNLLPGQEEEGGSECDFDVGGWLQGGCCQR